MDQQTGHTISRSEAERLGWTMPLAACLERLKVSEATLRRKLSQAPEDGPHLPIQLVAGGGRGRGRSAYHVRPQHFEEYIAKHRLSEITIAEVARYRNSQVRDGLLKPRSINMHLALLAQILEVAVEYGQLARNPASGRRRRLKAPRPRPVHLDTAEHIAAVLDAAALLDADKDSRTIGRRAAVAAMLFAGLRAEEVGALRWRDVDLANGRLHVGAAKTSAGVREIDLLPILRDDLLALKASGHAGQDDPVFVTSTGVPRDRHNLRQRVVAPIARKADEMLAERDARPLPAGLSPHKLRHTFASLLVALGNDPAYVMGQLGQSR